MGHHINRRTFVYETAAIASLAAVSGRASARVLGANDRVRLGFIGVGNRGDQLIDAFVPHKDTEIVALCDVYEPYLNAARAKVGGSARAYGNFRELLDQSDIDAVVIATPDHWHALQMIEACRAGKDVYVEKPLSLTIHEGRQMVQAAHETDRVTQVGLHRRSSQVYREAVERIRSGEIGHITSARCFHLTNESPIGIGREPDGDPPAGLDWEAWLGPAPMVNYNPNRCLYKFRWFWDYSGGQLTNMGAHYLDVIQWALGQAAPRTVMAAGGKFGIDDSREIPDTLDVVWQYDGPTLVSFTQRNANGSDSNSHGWEIEFRGTKGTIGFNGNGYDLIPERTRTRPVPSKSPIARNQNREDGRAVETSGKRLEVPGADPTAEHAKNFLDCVRSRATTNCPIEVGHQSTTATLLGNIAHEVGRAIHWDAAQERAIGDDEANSRLIREYRAPWKLA